MDKIDFEREPDFQRGYLRGLADCKRALDDTDSRILKKCADVLESHPAEIGRAHTAIVQLWTSADTSDLDAEMALYVGGIVAAEMYPDMYPDPAADKQDGT